MYWYLQVIKYNYANFSGRARRKEYWMFVLIQLVIFVLVLLYASLVDDLIGSPVVSIILAIYVLATLVPWLALNVRRLHDIGKSGSFFLINFIPVIGRIWYVVLMATEGEFGTNQYGQDPKLDYSDEIDEIGQLQN